MTWKFVKFVASAASLLEVGCNQVLGLDNLSIIAGEADAGRRECSSHSDCVGRASEGASAGPAICVEPEGRCVSVLSEDCRTVTGNPEDENAVIVGSLLYDQTLAAGDPQASAILAVEQINAAGGIPSAAGDGPSRPLVLVSCEESQNARRAATHLAKDLRVPAIVGPTTSQNTLELTTQLTASAGTLLLSPTAVASSIADLIDHGLTWQMVPSDVQRAPLMIQQINELEAGIRAQTGRDRVKLAVAFRDDALGVGTRTALNELVFNSKPLVEPDNRSESIRLSPYDASAPDQASLVAEYASFAPDIVVLAGTGEAITQIMIPLEEQWTSTRRPLYVVIDSARVNPLLDAVRDDSDLRTRVRGTGIAPTAASAPVFDAFRLDYEIRHPNGTPLVPTAAPAYDAVFAVAYAIAATEHEPLTGAAIAKGLRKLGSGPVVEVANTKILAAFQELSQGRNISAIGTFGPLRWNQDGAIAGGQIEVWCIGRSASAPVYKSSGLAYDLESSRFEGAYAPCD